MRLKNYLNEKQELTGDYNKDKVLKQMDKFKKDIRKLTKIFRSLDKDSSNKEWRDLFKYFKKYQDNFERWIYKELLYKKDSEVESWEETQVRKTAWKALMEGLNDVIVTGVNIDTYNRTIEAKKTLKTREKIIRRYNKLLSETWKAIEELIKSEEESIQRIDRIKNFNYAGVNITFDYGKKSLEEISKWIPKMEEFVKQLKSLLQTIENKGLDIMLKDMRVELTLDEINADGEYNLYKDAIVMSLLGFGSDAVKRVFFHETAHRYYYKYMTNSLQKRWEVAIREDFVTIKQKDIQEFVDKYYPFDAIKTAAGEDYEKELLMQNEESMEKVAIYATLIGNFPFQYKNKLRDGEDVKDEILDYYNDFVGTEVSTQFISNYANTNSSEAWAEAVAIWMEKGMSQLPPKTRYMIKSMFSDMGIKINESKFMEYLEREEEEQ